MYNPGYKWTTVRTSVPAVPVVNVCTYPRAYTVLFSTFKKVRHGVSVGCSCSLDKNECCCVNVFVTHLDTFIHTDQEHGSPGTALFVEDSQSLLCPHVVPCKSGCCFAWLTSWIESPSSGTTWCLPECARPPRSRTPAHLQHYPEYSPHQCLAPSQLLRPRTHRVWPSKARQLWLLVLWQQVFFWHSQFLLQVNKSLSKAKPSGMQTSDCIPDLGLLSKLSWFYA